MISLTMKNPFPRKTFERRLWNRDCADIGKKWEEDGFQACEEWNEEMQVEGAEAFAGDRDPVAVPYPDCPWPLLTAEGKAWIRGWNLACIENYLDEER